jgi:acetyl esterase/lipase
MRARDRARLTALGTVVLLALVLGSCWVNQNNIAIADRVNPSAAVTIGRQSLDVAYGPDAAQLLDVYAPAGTTVGTIVYFHSGGWTGGSKAAVPPIIFQQLNRGWAVVSVDYRLAGTPGVQAPQVVADVDRSIRYVKANAATLQIDTSTVVSAGWSAGGQLALMAAVAPGYQIAPDLPAELAAVDPKVDAVISMAATADPLTWAGSGTIGLASVESFLGCSTDGPDALAACDAFTPLLYSPVFRAGFSAMLGLPLPPAYIAYGADDPMVPMSTQGLPLSSAWTAAAGDRTTYVDVPPTGGHDVPAGMNKTVLDSWLTKVATRTF